jgi:DNA-binding CsgD family transcriptional regulator/tetratricopeptide (TPR) repeat protein
VTGADRLLVGRELELAAVAKLGPARPVALVGEAGIGKTTLLRAAARRSGRRSFEGICLASLSWMSYLPLARALGEQPPRGDHAFVAAWAASRTDGGLLLLDDLQWADADTLALLPLLTGRVTLVGAIRRGDAGTARAEAVARDAGFELISVGGLPDAEARAIVRRRRPELGPGEVAAIVGRAGGNPLLLEEFARDGGTHESLRLSLGARLHRCSQEAQEAMALLGLLGRPAEPELLPPHVAELVDAGLVTSGSGLAPRHALLGEAAAAELDEETRRRLHVRIAGLVREPGEAARHLHAAGEQDAARAKALAAAGAAERPGERARHLAVAAACSAGAEGDELRLQAAEALVAAGEHERALELLAGVEGDDADVRARTAFLRSRARFWMGHMETHREDIEEGLALVSGAGSATEVRLRIEESRLALWDWEENHVETGVEVLALAEAANVDVAKARVLLGIAYYVDGDPRCFEHLRAAVAAALEEDDHELVSEAAEFLCGALQADGQPAAAEAEALAMQSWCRDHGLRTNESIFRWVAARVVSMSRGSSTEAIADLRSALADPGVGARADQIAADLANSLADLGRLEEARATLDATPARTPAGKMAACVARAEVEWSAGRSAAALAVLDELELERLGVEYGDYAAAAYVARGWSLLDLGRRQHPVRSCSLWQIGAGARPELDALALGIEPAAAARAQQLFDEAADLHGGQLLRWELRCRWGAAEAAGRAGDAVGARRRLLALEERLDERGMVSLLGRVRRSLRRVGVPRTEPRRTASGAVSAREREVLELVAAGQSTAEIALRLGLSPATVESQVRSAMTKLGAKTRLQAAVRAAAER